MKSLIMGLVPGELGRTREVSLLVKVLVLGLLVGKSSGGMFARVLQMMIDSPFESNSIGQSDSSCLELPI
jgi:hypothetical protein